MSARRVRTVLDFFGESVAISISKDKPLQSQLWRYHAFKYFLYKVKATDILCLPSRSAWVRFSCLDNYLARFMSMKHILHVDSSPRGDRSISRNLTKGFITAWKEMFPGDTVTYRNLGHYPVPLIDESWIAASFTPTEQINLQVATVLALSDELIDEL
jgi:hypothetical protein